jgi:hypothetical protein
MGFLKASLCAVESLPHQENHPSKSPEGEIYSTDKILLQALDKVTGKVITIEAEINKPKEFGTLSIIPRFCQKAAPEDSLESTAFLEIFEKKPTNQGNLIFQGWMFASYPAVSALEHPVYDVWVKECSGSIIQFKEVPPSPHSKNKSTVTNEMKAFYEGLGENPEANALFDTQKES